MFFCVLGNKKRKFTFHYELIITEDLKKDLLDTFKFIFHYELIITVKYMPAYKNEKRFTFHYELIITKCSCKNINSIGDLHFTMN